MTTAVFVHGNPETDAIWRPLLSELGRPDVATLSPPGFGAPVPKAFGATADEYAAWLTEELRGFSEPVDLVGHDWGGGHVIRMAVDHPELIRSWTTDTGGIVAPDYEWHDLAQVWQTPGAGEEAVAGMTAASLADRIALYESLGMSHGVAAEVARATDETMGRCVLALYRSAAQPYLVRLGQQLPKAASRPGLMIVATEDPYVGGEDRARWAAERSGAKVALLPGLGHWWMLQDPAAGAAALREFWSSIR